MAGVIQVPSCSGRWRFLAGGKDGRECVINGEGEGGFASRFGEAFGDVQVGEIKDGAFWRAEPEQGQIGMRPGKNAHAIGRFQRLRAQVPPDRDHTLPARSDAGRGR